MHLNWGFLKFQLGNQVREKIKITQIQHRFVLKLSTYLKFGMTCIPELRIFKNPIEKPI